MLIVLEGSQQAARCGTLSVSSEAWQFNGTHNDRTLVRVVSHGYSQLCVSVYVPTADLRMRIGRCSVDRPLFRLLTMRLSI